MSREGFIYFVCDDKKQFLKIGRTKDVEKRLKALESKNKDKNLELIASIKSIDAVTHELMIHQLFVSERVAGVTAKQAEWYYYTGATKEFVKIAIEKGINEAVEQVAKNNKEDREDWRTWSETCAKYSENASKATGSTSLNT